MDRGPIFRRLTVVVGATLALAAGGSLPANAAPGPDTAEAAAGWLARQLADGERMETVFDGTTYPDQGLTADVVLALDSAKAGQEYAARATAWLSTPDVLSGYLGDGTTESYAGAHAKLALVAQAQGENPASFGGVDLISRLTALQAPSGRFSDKSSFGDNSNGITQALAVVALERAGTAPAPSVDYLAGSACPDGGFPLYFEQPTCASDVDTTGLVTQALLAAGRTAEAGKALDWLQGKQQGDGGFGGSGPTPGVNANSTGLAAAALHAGGRTAPAERAAGYLTALRVGCAGAAADQGAIAYDGAGFRADNARRSTAQAIPGITGIGLSEVSAEGARGPAPVLDCGGAPAPSTPDTPPADGNQPLDPVDRGRPELAATGADLGTAVTLGAVLLLAGAGLLVPRRRGTSS
jgi:hypothetical protein